ncbi:NAD-dependent epimerase/dehydratase family protein [Dellaglioa carnosa]|uniref:NAD-dependent epimerase/dehydratase family protein n=1 Tax=Dellaglioa carnosa TaxID=2995136 RepID=A0ABT4JMN0_9LACO|nr:NAD-dependent epimerase/dehydratase family protein [Dellaglioa carnosa]MCZ2491588.1 NAD-dependent epimerase/dehydratase family protein [Dellaglioa carnosa]MCZ2494665.1 NAD-dependent epimerase/dehydratase family protein [Dellaglioa carnosa]MDK1731528.1 NAD-dependent epimerase/dehydratase family protein [Dellaglioa carnosa]
MSKKVLITGENSYIGNLLKKKLQHSADDYEIDTISVRGDSWRENNFGQYDSIVHVAAIVHSKQQVSNLYYEINRDLVGEVAKKAKNEGVEQFLFLSSMAVYGLAEGAIEGDTIPHPKNDYGKSKLEAENLLIDMESKKFTVSIVRPPMIYGPGAKGNYTMLRKIALIAPVLPKINNRRSMLFIDNLLTILEAILSNKIGGIIYPQNDEYTNTSKMMTTIRKAHGKKTIESKLLGSIVISFKNIPGSIGVKITKAFGTLYYSKTISDNVKYSNEKSSLVESIYITEKMNIK